MGWLMYYKDDRDQLGIDEFFLPFGGKLKKDNRWVRTAGVMPWDYIEEVYLQSMSQETGRAAFPARIAYGAIYVKEQEELTDEETVSAIAENPYIQYFLGLKVFHDEPLFNASMMVHFRKRFPVEALVKINEYICIGKRPQDECQADHEEDDNEPPKSGGVGKPNKNTSKKKLERRKQKEMFENGTHTCENRIVSLQQPHVRPINRGKRPNPTEFGQKLHLSVVDGYTYLERTSWNNFNEGNDLISATENYRRKFGCYPTAILADRIYQTRKNRAYCAQHGIRLSGPPLGRRKAGETDAAVQRQIYRDACERNAVEGRNGNAKRRWGLDLIMSKLDETAKAEAALNIIAMNVAHRLARWLLRFFGFPRLVLVFQWTLL